MGNQNASLPDNDEETKQPPKNNDKYTFGICKSTKNCASLTRIIDALKFYDIHHNDNNKLSEYLSKDNESINIINDYHHILDCHLNEDNMTKNQSNASFELIYKEMMKNKLKCDISSCKMYLRNNRQREKERIECKDKNMAIYIDILDSIHCYFIHSVDVGYRIIHNIRPRESKNKNKNNDDYDAEIANLKSYLVTKRQNLEKIRGRNRFLQNKFMTEISITNETESKASNEEKVEDQMDAFFEQTIDTKDVVYSFGEKFSYAGNFGWKYSSLKQELTNNTIYSIDMNIFNQIYNECQMLIQHSNQIKTMNLKIDNIVVVKLYTDCDTLSYNFTATFRKLQKNKTRSEVRLRNNEYYWWSKTLSETVEEFGTKMKDSNVEIFYHGVSKIYFNKFIAQFNSPTSTTSKLQIATIFAKHTGIILELKMYNGVNSKHLPYFNCTYISSFANEDERLFITIQQPKLYLEFNSIRNLSTNENYKNVIEALTVMDDIVDAVDRTVSAKCSKKILSLLNSLNSYDNNHPEYVINSVKKWLDQRRSIHINLKYLNGAYDFLCGIFLSQKKNSSINNLLSFEKINMMFKNVTDINCYTTGCLSEEHMIGLLSSLDGIDKLQYSKLAEICLHDVLNISSLMEEYKSTFAKTNWKMEIDEIQEAVLKIHRIRI